MGFISAFGTGFAARTQGSVAGRMLICLLALPLLAAEAPIDRHAVVGTNTGVIAQESSTLDVHFGGLRSAKGLVRACLTRNPKYFPNCQNDPQAMKASVSAEPNARMAFSGLAAGDYALTVLHDENANSKVDTVMGIPREGVGFSRNPAITFGPPSFTAARLHIGSGGAVEEEVRIKYFL